jgi:hypothetical protein
VAEKALLNKPRDKQNLPPTPRYISYEVEKALLSKGKGQKTCSYTMQLIKHSKIDQETNASITLLSTI